MKHILLIAISILFSFTHLTAQSPISLPIYYQGQYEVDTIYNYYGPLQMSGIGSISLGGTLATNFITGVDFKMVVDSTNKGPSPTHAAFYDSLGTLVPMYKGDTLSIPASFQLFAGDVGFHVLIEGTPLVAGESYLCDLAFAFTLGNDWEMAIIENSPDTCIVGQFQGLNNNLEVQLAEVYPNPFNQFTFIEFEINEHETYNFILYDLPGKEVRRLNNIRSSKIKFEKGDLQAGTYIFQLQNKGIIVATGKLIVEQ